MTSRKSPHRKQSKRRAAGGEKWTTDRQGRRHCTETGKFISAKDETEDLTETTEPDGTMPVPDVSKLKLSAYMPAEPKLWFGIVEAKMALAGLDPAETTHQKPMFALVVGELPQEVARTVKTKIKSPKPETAYNDIKTAILGKHQETPT